MLNKYGLVMLIGVLFFPNESFSQSALQNYVFFNLDRERIQNASFLENNDIKGAQLKYTWPELEPKEGEYHFESIQQDLDFLSKNGKGLFIQIQDVSFDTSIVNVPQYLFDNPLYNGGGVFQYGRENDESPYHVEGWVARRWDKEVAHRFHALLRALGEQFDGRIEGINLPETSIGVGSEDMHPVGFTYDAYLEAIKENMLVLKAAFPNSSVIIYANFMPGDDFPLTEDSYLKRLYRYAQEIKVGVGGPDIKVHKWWPMRHSYPLIRECDGVVPTGVAVQWGNYEVTNPKTKKQVTVPEIHEFARDYLKLDYLFWGTQEPYYSEVVMTKKEVKVSEEKTAAPVFYPLSTLRDDIDSAFDRMFKDWPRFGKLAELDPFREMDFWKRPSGLAPRVDVSEDENTYEIAAEVPGVEEEDVSVTVADGKLTLRGEKKTEKEETKKDYHMKERSYGAFERSFRLPEEVEADKISAAFENGVLNVTLPKSAKAKSEERKIEVKKK